LKIIILKNKQKTTKQTNKQKTNKQNNNKTKKEIKANHDKT
jgi:hypothetical protein